MAMTTMDAAGFQPRKTRSLTALFRAFQNRLGAPSRTQRDFDALRNASDHLLADLGLTRSQVSRALNTAPTYAGYDPVQRFTRTEFRRI